MSNTPTRQTFPYGKHQVTIETGEIARQAGGSVLVSMGDTVILATVVGVPSDEPKPFFPLMVVYQERAYAGGRIPGGFFKREGRPSTRETLIARLIDRPIRPLFPNGFTCDVQVVVTVMSMDPEVSPDVPGLIAASAALSLSGLPFAGPVGAARVGYREGSYLLNPSFEELKESELDLVVAGTSHGVLMVESEAKELPEDVMLGAVNHGHQAMQAAIDAINALKSEAGKPAWDWQAPATNEALFEKVKAQGSSQISEAYQIADKLQRQEKLSQIKEEIVGALVDPEDESISEGDVKKLVSKLEKEIVRSRVLSGAPRIDGRDLKTVRPIKVRTGVLPRTHGSALFTRGETQAIVVATLGTGRDAQIIDNLEGDDRDYFMLHYNFPPYCVGETGMMGSPKRREIGHGQLAKRGMAALIPSQEDFPYVLRVVSEITESNGSSSMASVCGTSLALMDAGVPLRSHVAGIAMGLVKEGDSFAVLTDILGDEDHLGDMDFKVAGTDKGVTALQMDIKIDGITKQIMETALAQAKDGRMHILGIMNEHLPQPRTQMSQHAPRIMSIKIDPEKIADVIGKGGATIRGITEETGATIDIQDDGTIHVAAVEGAAADAAAERIELIVTDLVVGDIYVGKVTKLADFGAFVNLLPGKNGLVHISQICEERVETVSDHLQEGQLVRVKVLEVDRQGRIRLTMKDVDQATLTA